MTADEYWKKEAPAALAEITALETRGDDISTPEGLNTDDPAAVRDMFDGVPSKKTAAGAFTPAERVDYLKAVCKQARDEKYAKFIAGRWNFLQYVKVCSRAMTAEDCAGLFAGRGVMQDFIDRLVTDNTKAGAAAIAEAFAKNEGASVTGDVHAKFVRISKRKDVFFFDRLTDYMGGSPFSAVDYADAMMRCQTPEIARKFIVAMRPLDS